MKLDTNIQNKFCRLENLCNESDVEQFFITPLLKDIGYKPDYIATKKTIKEARIDKGTKSKRNYKPDYILYLEPSKKNPLVIIDAKSPDEKAEEGVSDSQLYAGIIRRDLDDPKPDQYCIGSNGVVTIVTHYDSNTELFRLNFSDFQDDNESYERMKSFLARTSLQKIYQSKQMSLLSSQTPVKIRKPTIDEIKCVFQQCHDLIFKRESLLPTQAFYEFTKLVFLKLNEDKRLHKILDAGDEIHASNLMFHTYWIDNHLPATPNPVNDILFVQLRKGLEDLVDQKKKKPIFDKGEQIKLKPSTIHDVVSTLQEYDLYGIDEDLNGRMFEVFLAAIVRGKKLGAYFTPRNIVDLIVSMVEIKIMKKGGTVEIEDVLDGCCGSGGFLIDAMASLIQKIRTNPNLASDAPAIIDDLVRNHLYGIEANADIARIARINMYLHGDGGSSIYNADALDKTVKIEQGTAKALKKELDELSDLLMTKSKKFNVIITNPPFATSYKSKDDYERRIMQQYADHEDQLKNLTYKEGTTELKTEIKSNILFVARYHDLLAEGGRLIIVLDNSLLNSMKFAEYRTWIKNNFIVRAVISLPKYAFIQAGAGGVTSILYLEKRKDFSQEQPPIFARSVKFTGLSKSGKEIDDDDLPDVLKEWKQFEATGKLYLKGKKIIGNYESDTLFLIDKVEDRFDVDFYMPSYRNLMKKLARMEKDGTHTLFTINKKDQNHFEICPHITKEDIKGKVFKYADIGAIDYERCELVIKECQEDEFEELPDRAQIIVKENDVIFPLSYDSLGKIAIIPKEMNDQLVSTGFMGIQCKSNDDAVLLWAIIRSETMQKQFLHVASGYTQRGISKEHLETHIKFPIPKDDKNKLRIVQQVKNLLKDATEARQKEIEAYARISEVISSP